MGFYWVNLGTSLKEVEENKFLWAPAYLVAGDGKVKENAGWNAVKNVQAGDVIFCHAAGKIRYVAIATNDAQPAPRPQTRTYKQWAAEGYRIDVRLIPLTTAIDISVFASTLHDVHNELCFPRLFTREGKISQQYMVRLPDGAGSLILSNLGDELVKLWEEEKNTGINKSRPTGSTRETIIQARIGQGRFRRDVLMKWNSQCPITGVANVELLVASHIVPWALSNDVEKVDPNNGILFSPNVDRLFDKGYISFDETGSLILKQSVISHLDLQKLGIKPNASIAPSLNNHQRAYLARHRQMFHFSK